MEWDSESPAYRKMLTDKQMKQVDTRREEKKQSAVYEAMKPTPNRKNYKSDKTYQEQIKQRKKAKERIEEMIATLGLSHEKAQELLVDYHQGQGTRSLSPAHILKGKALAKLYGKPEGAWRKWRDIWLKKQQNNRG